LLVDSIPEHLALWNNVTPLLNLNRDSIIWVLLLVLL
jgi:hypothetical protein